MMHVRTRRTKANRQCGVLLSTGINVCRLVRGQCYPKVIRMSDRLCASFEYLKHRMRQRGAQRATPRAGKAEMNPHAMLTQPLCLASAPLPFDALPSHVNAGVPLDLLFTVLPGHPSNQLFVEHTSDGRKGITVRGSPEGVDPMTGAQRFRVRMPPLAPDETALYAPVLTRAGLLIQALPIRSTRGMRTLAEPAVPDTFRALPMAGPRYEWASEFLGAFSVRLVKPPESMGPCPDGMRIIYRIDSGEVSGPRINGIVRGGDWMVVRRDGVGVAESRITYETSDGALLLSRYSGILDLGPQGYERAQRNDFDPHPPVVLAPQFITSHPNWLWLNRLQCIAVGRANMTDLSLRVDIYAIRAGQPLPSSGLPRVNEAPLTGDTH